MLNPYLGTLFLHVFHDVIVLLIIGQLLHCDGFLEPDYVGGPRQDGRGDDWGVHVRHVHVRLGLLCSCDHVQQSLFLTTHAA